jgi:hypothetical protein
VVLLQVNRFHVDDDTVVLIPSLQGNIDQPPPRGPATPPTRLTRTSLLESFAHESEQETVARLLDAAAASGATFEYGPSGVSVRVQTAVVRPPVTVAWIFAPGKLGWQRTRDVSFGHGQDYPATPPALRMALEEYFEGLVAAGIGEDVSSKGVRARAVSPAEAAKRVDDLTGRLRRVITTLQALQPDEFAQVPV